MGKDVWTVPLDDITQFLKVSSSPSHAAETTVLTKAYSYIGLPKLVTSWRFLSSKSVSCSSICASSSQHASDTWSGLWLRSTPSMRLHSSLTSVLHADLSAIRGQDGTVSTKEPVIRIRQPCRWPMAALTSCWT